MIKILTETTEDVSLGVHKSLALLLGDILGQFAHVLLDDVRELHHDRLTGQDAGLGPGLVGTLARVHGRLHFAGRGLGHLSDHVIGRGIVQVDPLLSLRLDELSVDEELCRGSGRGEATPGDLVQALRWSQNTDG